MKNTILRTFDFKRVIIPNYKFVRSVIKTYSLEQVLRLEVEMKVDASMLSESLIDDMIALINTYDFVIYKEYTQVLVSEVDLTKKKEIKIKGIFCFNPNA